ncbi:centromere protein X isoform X2 [Scyliorhinus torazame]|uniref:centromere protein X isoform X2 n=1 Tax=Scyliorhinus torazame TaxID=75743 RepID=UPI003B5CAD8A
MLFPNGSPPLCGRLPPAITGRPRHCSVNELVSKLLYFYFKDQKTKVSSDAVTIMCEMLKIFVIEAAARTARQASNEDSTTGDIEHFEKVLPQLVIQKKHRLISFDANCYSDHNQVEARHLVGCTENTGFMKTGQLVTGSSLP